MCAPPARAARPTPSLTRLLRTDVGIALNELENLHLYCSAAKLAASGGVCPSMHGEDKIKELGLDEYTVGFCAGILVLYIVFCRVVAFLGVRYIKH